MSEFKRKVNTLSHHYLEQKANFYAYEQIQEEKNANSRFSEISDQEFFDLIF